MGRQLWLDPGSPEVQDYVIALCATLSAAIHVAGVHLDDYFYPYPDTYSGSFPDESTYARYQARGGRLTRAEWRRNKREHDDPPPRRSHPRARPSAMFGVSPFGIYTKGQPPT